MGWFQEQRERSDRIGYVLTRWSLVSHRTVLVSRKVYHSLPEAAKAAVKADRPGKAMVFVDAADKFGVAA